MPRVKVDAAALQQFLDAVTVKPMRPRTSA
jgi:hypothetical protein